VPPEEQKEEAQHGKLLQHTRAESQRRRLGPLEVIEEGVGERGAGLLPLVGIASAKGQSRRFGRQPTTSGVPRLADIARTDGHVGFVP
jgi:hypothetical protein